MWVACLRLTVFYDLSRSNKTPLVQERNVGARLVAHTYSLCTWETEADGFLWV